MVSAFLVLRAITRPSMLANMPSHGAQLGITIRSPHDKRSWGFGVHGLKAPMEFVKDLLKQSGSMRAEGGQIKVESHQRRGGTKRRNNKIGVEVAMAESRTKSGVEDHLGCTNRAPRPRENGEALKRFDTRLLVSYSFLDAQDVPTDGVCKRMGKRDFIRGFKGTSVETPNGYTEGGAALRRGRADRVGVAYVRGTGGI